MTSLRLNRILSLSLMLLAVIGSVAIWVVTDVATRLSAATGAAIQSADVLEDSIATADSVIAAIDEGLEGADLIVADISASTELSAEVIEDASALVSNDIADSVEAIERALPGLVEAGSVIDNTLSTLEFFGVSYDTDVPFGEALVGVEASVAGLATELRVQGAGLGKIAPPIRRAGEETAALAQVLGDVQESLGDARSQLAEYRVTAADLREAAGTDPVDPGLLETVGRLFALVWAATGVLAGVAVWRR